MNIFFMVVSATVMKLMSSGDDVAWLSPFYGKKVGAKVLISVVYVATLEIVVLLAWGMARALKNFDFHPDVLQLLCGAALLGFSFQNFLGWWKVKKMGRDKAEKVARDEGKGVVISVFLTTLAGSMDELSYFTALITVGTFSPWHLAAGTLVAGVLVVLVCMGITQLGARVKALNRILEAIPLWLIMGMMGAIYAVEAAPTAVPRILRKARDWLGLLVLRPPP